MTINMPAGASANEEQERFWNDVAGPLWVAAEVDIECHTGPFGDVALAVALPANGEAVLDVGCGCGSTAVALAEAVGAGGTVLGVDLSAAMLARAEERLAAGEAPQVRFRRADAQSADLGSGSVDLAFSRFGVMFFSDPVAGFANLRRALRSDGRMVFACWQAPSANPWMAVVNRAAARIFGVDPPPHDAPGPFSLADPERIRAVLDAAAFRTVEITAHQERLRLGVGQAVEDWVHQRLIMGPARPGYLGADPARQSEVRATIAEALAGYRVDADDPMSGLAMDAAAWIVAART
ncbi:class I SAM-dependent methyltransferase [Acidiferrimicrobium sp. IK]|uniref:class I SAM-dependent methyltransferase n=1 Tax=Acidiferrimicrobium sp. IK TaxID=2871700 RepID=UPI0021CAF7B8|nr:class I SAM-dependent methyltransferase [Acidiferrimicrobium sp. IK]MCU4185123.1 class I SAM-dependent methyltransferase [Acidiferrimicrobium sp. IK]